MRRRPRPRHGTADPCARPGSGVVRHLRAGDDQHAGAAARAGQRPGSRDSRVGRPRSRGDGPGRGGAFGRVLQLPERTASAGSLHARRNQGQRDSLPSGDRRGPGLRPLVCRARRSLRPAPDVDRPVALERPADGARGRRARPATGCPSARSARLARGRSRELPVGLAEGGAAFSTRAGTQSRMLAGAALVHRVPRRDGPPRRGARHHRPGARGGSPFIRGPYDQGALPC